MQKDYTHIITILDRSGSMQAIKNDTIGGFNTFLQDQKDVEGKATVTLVQFDNEYSLIEDFTDIQNVKELSNESFVPRGATALHDAIGKAVTDVGKKLSDMSENSRPENVVVCVITDGLENTSKEWAGSSVKSLVEQQMNDYSWEFVFLGANQDAILTSKDLGFSAGSTMTYAATPRGVNESFSSISKNMKNYRTKAVASMDFDAEDLEAQKEAGV